MITNVRVAKAAVSKAYTYLDKVELMHIEPGMEVGQHGRSRADMERIVVAELLKALAELNAS